MAREQGQNRALRIAQNRRGQTMKNQHVSWSGRQDSNLHQALEIAQGDSETSGEGGVATGQNPGAILNAPRDPSSLWWLLIIAIVLLAWPITNLVTLYVSPPLDANGNQVVRVR
jgi:hypothetical protein